MRAVLIAAALAAMAAPAYAGFDASEAVLQPNVPPLARVQASAACEALAQKTSDMFGGKLLRLDRLPPGLLEHAVLRTVQGCPVREVLYRGVTYWLQQPGAQTQATPLAERAPDSGSRVIRH